MSEVLSIIRLRWTMQRSAMHAKPVSMVMFVLGLLFSVALIAGTGICCWSLGSVDMSESSILHAAMLLVGALLSFGALLLQVMSLGQGTVLSLSKFELFGIRDGVLSIGLLLASICGIPGITILLTLLASGFAYRSTGVAVMVTAVVSAFLAVITIFVLTRIITILLSSVTFSKKGKNILYVGAFLILMAISQLPNLLGNDYLELLLYGSASRGVLGVLAWTPFVAAFQLPFDAMAGQWLFVAIRVLIIVATWAFCHWLCMWHLRKARQSSGSSTVKVVSGQKGLGLFRFVPDNVSGAVSARLAIYLRKDVRQISILIIPLLLVVMAAFRGANASDAVWQATFIGPLFVMICESNGLAYDGRGLYMEAICGVRGWHDRLGRARVNVAIIVAYSVLLMVIAFAITGYWKTPEHILEGLIYMVAAMSVGLCSLGVAEVVSCTLMYPVAPMDRPFSAPQGRGATQFLFPIIHIVVSLVTLVPSILVVVLLLITHNAALMWIMMPVSLINGLAVLFLGSWLGGKLMDARMTKILSTLDDFASLQQ